jgi:hypothetical protein
MLINLFGLHFLIDRSRILLKFVLAALKSVALNIWWAFDQVLGTCVSINFGIIATFCIKSACLDAGVRALRFRVADQ